MHLKSEIKLHTQTLAFLFALFTLPLFGQAPNAANADQSAIVDSAQRAAVKALNFRQGDAAGLTRAKPDFTPEGWSDFMKHMQGFVDDKGTPTFTSSFVPSRDATILGEKDGVVHFRVPGTLTQTNNLGKTTYRAAVEVYALRDGSSIKIQHLEQITCAGASPACQ